MPASPHPLERRAGVSRRSGRTVFRMAGGCWSGDDSGAWLLSRAPGRGCCRVRRGVAVVACASNVRQTCSAPGASGRAEHASDVAPSTCMPPPAALRKPPDCVLQASVACSPHVCPPSRSLLVVVGRTAEGKGVQVPAATHQWPPPQMCEQNCSCAVQRGNEGVAGAQRMHERCRMTTAKR